jgi:hypothetical protein
MIETDMRFDQWVDRLSQTCAGHIHKLTKPQRQVLALLRLRGHALWRYEMKESLGYMPRQATVLVLVRHGLVRLTNQGVLRT